MITVTAETSWSSSLDRTWKALGRRASYLCFPGLTERDGALHHELDLPIVDGQDQAVTLSVRGARNGRRERRFTVRGELLTIAGCWRLDPAADGVRARLTLDYAIDAGLKTRAVNTLRSRSPLPIRTDADAILSRAVDEFFETRFAEHAATYCERLRERLGDARSA
jgi:hypothetical protein